MISCGDSDEGDVRPVPASAVVPDSDCLLPEHAEQPEEALVADAGLIGADLESRPCIDDSLVDAPTALQWAAEAASHLEASEATEKAACEACIQAEEANKQPVLLRWYRAGHNGGISNSAFTSCCFVSSKRQILTGLEDGSLLVWPAEAERTHSFRPLGFSSKGTAGQSADSPVSSVAASPDGDLLAGAYMDGCVRVWRNQAGRQTPILLKLHFLPVRGCDFCPSQPRLFLTCSDDKTIKLSSLAERKFVASMVGHSHWVQTAVFSPKGHLVASGGDDKTVRLWDVERRTPVRVWYDHTDSVSCVRFNASGACVAGASWDSTINLWDLRSNSLRQHYARAHGSSPITGISMHPTRDLMLSSSTDRTVRLWDLRAGRLRYTLTGHEAVVAACAWDAAPDADAFVSCDKKSLHLWELPPEMEARPATQPPASLPSCGAGGRRAEGEVFANATAAAVATKKRASPEPKPRPRATQVLSAGNRPRSRGPSDAYGRGRLPDNAPAMAKAGPSPHAAQPELRAISIPAATQAAAAPPRGQSMETTEALGRLMEKMVSQMDMVTRSLQALEGRMARTEEAVATLTPLVATHRASAVVGPA
eukprot:TRINITY_DN54219_c0_g1_i1.p1 TRINITY_DN54219_c0_g1~~TRINITY_DN54219_c0_g1_i1.p1  ORF type:complete len:593 (-),score=97.29 TRINITY_DN54219_c0_g1_i1:19-1797(-)